LARGRSPKTGARGRRWPARKQLPASAADHSHQRPQWLQQTGL